MQCQNLVWVFSDNVIDCGDFFLPSHTIPNRNGMGWKIAN